MDDLDRMLAAMTRKERAQVRWAGFKLGIGMRLWRISGGRLAIFGVPRWDDKQPCKPDVVHITTMLDGALVDRHVINVVNKQIRKVN